MKHLTFLFLMTLILWACNTSTGDEQSDEASDTTATMSNGEMRYTVSPFPASTAYPDAALKNINYQKGVFSCDIAGDDYKLGIQTPDAPQKGCANSADGQHIHLIVNTSPYAAKYEKAFEYSIADGDHYILAFLSRSYHESIKTPTAFKAVKAKVEDASFKSVAPIEQPMLFYSRPKGLYEGDDTKRILLDYYLLNCEDKDYQVKAEINGEAHMLPEWKPYYIEGLPAGENQIKLTLVDRAGKPVVTPLNPVTRKIQVNPAPTENM
jgi:hypothetical protein